VTTTPVLAVDTYAYPPSGISQIAAEKVFWENTSPFAVHCHSKESS